MMWFSVDITGECVQDGDYHRLCRQFQQAFIAAGAPPEMALFAQMTLHNDVRRIYFSPGSVQYVKSLIDAFGGKPCDGPGNDNVALMFGVPDAGWTLLDHAGGGAVDSVRKRQLTLHASERRSPVRPAQAASVSP